MCAANKQFLFYLLAALLLSRVVGALRSQELPNPGKTQALSPSSGSPSNSSNSDLTTWEKLSANFQEALTTQYNQLQQALRETETSKANSARLTFLLDESLKANDSLRNYNAQIAERMQERDEDLASAYAENGNLKARIATHWKAHLILGGILSALILFLVFKKALIAHFPFLSFLL